MRDTRYDDMLHGFIHSQGNGGPTVVKMADF